MIATSPDGQWALIRRGREISLLAAADGQVTARIELDSDDADLTFVGPPVVLAVVSRLAGEPIADREGGEASEPPEPRPATGHITLYQPPYLDAVARISLGGALRIAAQTGPRLVLVSPDGRATTIVRIAGRALSTQPIETGSPVELAIGLERNQVLFSLLRKLEVWDAQTCRPLLRMQLQLPPPPRIAGPALGHLWATRSGSDEILLCRLSDGRPFRHRIDAPIDEVIHHAASPLLMLVTPRGLVRLHCFAHALTPIEAPWRPGISLAQLVVGDDISLLGMADDEAEPWRLPIGGAGAPPISLDAIDVPGRMVFPAGNRLADRVTADGAADVTQAVAGVVDGIAGHADALEAIAPVAPRRDASLAGSRISLVSDGDSDSAAPSLAALRPAAAEPRRTMRAGWREPLVTFAGELLSGCVVELTASGADDLASSRAGELAAHSIDDLASLRANKLANSGAGEAAATSADKLLGAVAELPAVPADSELGQLFSRLQLPDTTQRALIILYSLYLVGESVSIVRLAELLGDWTEPLGTGELSQLAMLRRRDGRVSLRGAVSDFLDGAPPRAIRLVGDAATAACSGIARFDRARRTDAAIEAELFGQLGRLAVVEGSARRAVLEAYLHDATAVALVAPADRPLPWPRDAGMIIVTDAASPAWLASLPIW